MNWTLYFAWLAPFLGGVIGLYFIPQSMNLSMQFTLLGAWGAVLGFILVYIASHSSKKARNDTNDFDAALARKKPETELIPVVNGVQQKAEPTPTAFRLSTKELEQAIQSSTGAAPQTAPASVAPAPKAAESPAPSADALSVASKLIFPVDSWNEFCRGILKNRPFHEIVIKLSECLPELFRGSSGILYMYSDNQAELHQVFAFGEHSVGDPVISPNECASFNLAEIVVADYASPSLSGGCTHLHHRPIGYSFCAPIEGLEEHFGILTLQVDKLPAGETTESWKAKLSIVAATFGLFVANQNLQIRFQTHSIRDTLTGLFNRRYMEESLQREVSAASRHQTPIGMIMLHADALPYLRDTHGPHAVEQMLWELSQRLPRYIRYEDIPCRYDNDTLCVILPGADFDITRNRAEKIRHEIENLQIAYGNAILETTLSLGVAMLPQNAKNGRDLLEQAQQALLDAEAEGKNRVHVATTAPAE